jgi:hypothetical protein
MENTTEIKVKIFDDGKEPVTCENKQESCNYLALYYCALFSTELSLETSLPEPCPECMQARKEGEG